MAINLDKIENEQVMEVHISGPSPANRMFVYTGTAVFDFQGTRPQHWEADSLSFLVDRNGRTFVRGEFIRAIVTASLARVYNSGSWDYGGWRVDSVDADLDDESGHIEVTAELAVNDRDGYLQGLGYQVTVLAAVAD